jgi:hypothetical protein
MAREKQVVQMPEPEPVEQGPWNDLQPLLDHELARLPEKYRVVVLLCDLQGKTRQEAAGQLGVAEGTVASRLTRARTMLAKRLSQRGVALSGGSLAAGVPTSVVNSTVKAAVLLAVGQEATGAISVKVAALTEGVVNTMLLSKLKFATAMLLAAGLVMLAASLSGLAALAIEPPPPSKTGRPAAQEGGKRQTALEPVVIREDAPVTHLAWSPDGQIVATVGVNNKYLELRLYFPGQRPNSALSLERA